MVWSDVIANYIIEFINYGITIVILMIVYEVGSLLFHKKVTDRLTDWNKSPVLTALGLNEKGKRKKMTKLLNEYVEDEKELEMIDKVEDEVNNAVALVESVVQSNSLSKKNTSDILQYIKEKGNIDGALSDAITHLRRVEKKQTWREEKEMGKLIQKMKEKKLDTSRFEALENDILAKHRAARESLEKAKLYWHSNIQSATAQLNHLYSGSTTWPISGAHTGVRVNGVDLGVVITALNHSLKDHSFIGLIESAKNEQKDVISDVQGIMVEMRQAAA